MLIYPLIFSLTGSIILWLGIQILTATSYDATFLVSQAALYATVPLFPVEELKHFRSGYFKLVPESLPYAFFMVLGTVVVSAVNLHVYQDQILMLFGDPLLKRIYRLINYKFIPLTQIGGWLYQSLMVYFVAVVFGSRLGIRKYLVFAGKAYLGYLISTLLSLALNILIFDLTVLEENVLLRYTIGKFGEAFTLILLAFFIYYNEERFGLIKSCFIACLPTVIIILIQILL